MRKIFLFILLASSLFAQVYPTVDNRIVFAEYFDNASTVQSNGATTQSNVTYSNGVASFNGSSSYINYPKNLKGTFSVRIRFKHTTSAYQKLVDFRGADNNGVGYIQINNVNTITSTSGTNYINASTSTTTVIVNAWNELVISGITIRVGTGARNIVIGSAYSLAGDWLNGSIDFIEIYKGTLTASEVSLLYKQANNRELAITPNIYCYVKDGVITEQMGRTITNTNVAIRRDGQIEAMNFNKIDSKLDLGSFAGTGDLTICAWVKVRSLGEGDLGRVLDNGNLFIAYASPNRYRGSRINTSNIAAADNSCSKNKYYLVILTSTSAGVSNFYIGSSSALALSGTANQSSGTPVTGSTNLIIGNRNAQDRTFDGYIHSVRIFPSILTLEQMTQIWMNEKQRFGY